MVTSLQVQRLEIVSGEDLAAVQCLTYSHLTKFTHNDTSP